ncbi:MAG: tetratricopeptide repeat protein [Planctomycetota bacterium]|nr:tetratricopeptide repeat protein [Planctomycetota bacterium]
MMIRTALGALALAGGAACSRETAPPVLAEQPAGAQVSAGVKSPPGSAPAAAAPERAERSSAPAVVNLRRAIEFGDLDQARALASAADAAGPEGVLLRARIAGLEGRGVEAMRLLEAQKAARPRDPDVYAAAAELYASRDAFDTAWMEIVAGTKACGETPEILRAKGVCWVSRENGADRGLAALLAARAADPALPFCDRALGQAYLLVAKLQVKAEKLPEALASARLSLAHDPLDVDGRRFLGDCLAASGDFGGALALLRELIGEGQPLTGELALMEKRAGFARLLAQDKAGAIDHFLSARAAGLSDADLSSAGDILAEAARARCDAGTQAYERKDLERAEAEFRAALDLWPDDLAAKNHLALVRFRRDDPAEAARLWRVVLEVARKEGIELPEPVHVNLAQAELKRGEKAAARQVLEDYLRESPQGEWVGVTRSLLAQIDAGSKR